MNDCLSRNLPAAVLEVLRTFERTHEGCFRTGNRYTLEPRVGVEIDATSGDMLREVLSAVAMATDPGTASKILESVHRFTSISVSRGYVSEPTAVCLLWNWSLPAGDVPFETCIANLRAGRNAVRDAALLKAGSLADVRTFVRREFRPYAFRAADESNLEKLAEKLALELADRALSGPLGPRLSESLRADCRREAALGS